MDTSFAEGGIDITSASVLDVANEVGMLENCADDDGDIVSTGIGVGTGSDAASTIQMMFEEQMYPFGHGWS